MSHRVNPRRLPFRALASVLLGSVLAAGPALAARGQSLEAAVGLSSWYDNNLLQYSDQQLAQFESGLLPNRFSIKSRDDVTTNPSLALTWDLDRGGGRRHSLRLKGEGQFQAKDATADQRSASLAWRESFHGGNRFGLRGYYLPSYYLRQLREVVSGVYERAQFSLAIGEVSWTQALKRHLQAGFGYQIERRVYSPFFAERSSTTHQGGASLGFSDLTHRGELGLDAAYRQSRAAGADYPGGSASLYPDISYHGWRAGLNGRLEMVRRAHLRLLGDLDYRIEGRSYESDRPADRSHVGRKDLENIIEVGLRAQLRPHWSLRGFDRYDANHATYGGTAPPTTDPGSYTQNLVGVEIGWTGEVWKQARSAPSAEEGER